MVEMEKKQKMEDWSYKYTKASQGTFGALLDPYAHH